MSALHRDAVVPILSLRSTGRPVKIARLLSAVAAAFLLASPASADPLAPCARETFEGARYTVCTVALDTHAVRLFATDESGAALGGFARLPERIAAGPLVFAMNAGMFDDSLAPIGLYVEDGEELRALNTRDGSGNFHLKPNGVFLVDAEGARVMTSEAYARAGLSPEIATQSGPMLVIDGRLHPRFIEGSPSRKRRNGVGVAADGRIVFAISDGNVNFHEFGRLFRDALGVPNALFLDGGSVPSLFAPHLRRADGWRPLGPMLAVYARD